MEGRTSKWPLLLALVVAVASFATFRWVGRPDEKSAMRGPHSTAEAQTGRLSEVFGPIPKVAAEGDVPAHPAPSSSAPEITDELRSVARRMSRETEGLRVVDHPDGRRSVSLEGRFMHVSAVVKSADGKSRIRCFTDFQEMASALSGGGESKSSSPEIHAR